MKKKKERAVPPYPWGTSVWLGEDCRRLRESEQILRRRFLAWGAEEISLPCLEYASVFEEANAGWDDLFLFSDTDGKTLALRPELTIPAARIFAAAMTDRDLPVRVFYAGEVFRQVLRNTGRTREFRQVGYEVYGGDVSEEDRATVRLAVESLRDLGLKDVRIALGDSTLVPALLSAGDETERETILQSIRRRDRTALGAFEGGERLVRLLEFGFSPSRSAVESLASDAEFRDAVERLFGVAEFLRGEGIEVIVDPAMVPVTPYYTGIVFEGVARGHGRPVLVGGRYDNVVGRFGPDVPAIGFSVQLESILRG
ncbi:MAG: hypothetical protein D6679_07660 [Candidatus Hydrogenedentota bacterium]|nr:MAG: hypothetical protein D6679_07660 [Candidatus Hydrogenedentota bacterium]